MILEGRTANIRSCQVKVAKSVGFATLLTADDHFTEEKQVVLDTSRMLKKYCAFGDAGQVDVWIPRILHRLK